MRTLASTAIPMVRMIPAIPGRVRVNWKSDIVPKMIAIQMLSPISATMPAKR